MKYFMVGCMVFIRKNILSRYEMIYSMLIFIQGFKSQKMKDKINGIQMNSKNYVRHVWNVLMMLLEYTK